MEEVFHRQFNLAIIFSSPGEFFFFDFRTGYSLEAGNLGEKLK